VSELQEGTILTGERGKYTVQRSIGQGGMACVYLATDALLQSVAVKVIHREIVTPHGSTTSTPGSGSRGVQSIYQRFVREARVLELLRHPNIASFRDVGLIEEVNERYPVPFLVSEFVVGQTLEAEINQDASEKGLTVLCQCNGEPCSRLATPEEKPVRLSAPFMKLSVFLKIVQCLLLGFSHIHRPDGVLGENTKQIVHRDFKPENAIIVRDGGVIISAKIIDLGIASVTGDLARAMGIETSITIDGQVLGTPFYMPVEQCFDAANATTASDVFSIGTVCYIMLTGRHPFRDAASVTEYAFRLKDSDPYDPGVLADGIPHKIRMMVLKATARDAKGRYRTAFEMLQVVNSVISDLLDGQTPSNQRDSRTITSDPPVASPLKRRSPQQSVALPPSLVPQKHSLPTWLSVLGIIGIALGALYAASNYWKPDQATTERQAQGQASVQDSPTRMGERPAPQPSTKEDLAVQQKGTVDALCEKAFLHSQMASKKDDVRSEAADIRAKFPEAFAKSAKCAKLRGL
jgi:serine/threonine protein kinase